jgi:hypothetical protein
MATNHESGRAAHVMATVIARIEGRRVSHEVDTVLRQAYLDDPYSGAYDLPLLAELDGIPVRMIDGE